MAGGGGTEPQDPEPSTTDLEPEPLGRLERSGATTLGVLATGLGAWAVFATDNQAGSAVLIIAGAAFLLMGIQGTPLIRLGAGENSLELERRRKRKRVVIAVRAADSEAEIDAIVEGAAILDPSVANSPSFQSWVYEARIVLALRTLGASVNRQDVDLIGVDFTAHWNPRDPLKEGQRETDATVDIALKFLPDGRKLRLDGLPRLEGRPRKRLTRDDFILGMVIVTNAALSQSLEQYLAENPNRPVEVVRWRTDEDNYALAEALRRAAGDVETGDES